MHGKSSDTFNYRNLPAFAAYIDRIGAEQSNFRRFLIKEHRGPYYITKATINIETDGSIKCPVDYNPTPEEAEAIKAELKSVIASWPQSRGATKKLLQDLKGITTGTLFTFWDQPREYILFVQERRDKENGGKDYWPWTIFSDGQWRLMEPDDDLPFWKPPETRNKARIMVHEGAKAAEFVDGLINDPKRKKEHHPWRSELADYEHWGLIGGALAPHRTDYSELFKENPSEVVYVCDSDHNGESALQEVSKLLFLVNCNPNLIPFIGRPLKRECIRTAGIWQTRCRHGCSLISAISVPRSKA
jgi:hypothetical protein